MQRRAPLLINTEAIELLLHPSRTQGGNGQHLGSFTGKQTGTMGTG